MQINGVFQITDWQETTEQSFADGGKRTRATVTQTYDNALVGSSKVYYQMHYGKDGNADFNGFEYFEGTLNQQAVKWVLKHDGAFKSGQATSQFVVVSSNHRDFPVGVSGRFVSSESGPADFTIG